MLVTKKKKKRMRNGSKKRDRRKKLVFHLKKVKTHVFFSFVFALSVLLLLLSRFI